MGQNKQSNTWFYEFTRNKKSHFKSGFRTKQQAKEAEAARLDEIIRLETHPELANRSQANIDLTYGDAWRWYYETLSPAKADPQTDKHQLGVIEEYFGKDKKIREITAEDVIGMRKFLANYISRTSKKVLSLETVNHYHTLFKALINALIKHDKFDGKNPAAKVAIPLIPQDKPRFITIEEEKTIREAVQKHKKLWPYYWMGLHTGARVGELWAMRVKDVSLQTNTIFLPTTKSKKSRHVLLSPKTKEFVIECMTGKKPEDRLLGTNRTTVWTVSDWFSDIVDKIGLPDITFHCLRHTFVQRLLANNVSIYKVSKLVGHSSISVTESTYGHLALQDLEGAINKIDEVI